MVVQRRPQNAGLSGISLTQGGAKNLHHKTTGCEANSTDDKEWIGGCPTGLEEHIR